MQKTSNLMTIGGIMASFGGLLIAVPLGIQGYYATIVKDGPPHWLMVAFLIMYIAGGILGALGKAIVGVAGQGQDDIPTVPQVEAATAKAAVDQVVADAAAASKPAVPTKVIVEPTPKP